MKRSFLAAAVLAVIVSPAFAEDGHGIIVSGGAGATIPVSDLNDGLDPGVSVAGSVFIPVKGGLGFRGEYSYDRFSGSGDANPFIHHFAGGLQLTGNMCNGKMLPYGFVTAGGYDKHPDVSGAENKTDFGLGFGGGMNLRMGKNWGVGAEVAVNTYRLQDEERVANQNRWQWYLTPRGQLYYRF